MVREYIEQELRAVLSDMDGVPEAFQPEIMVPAKAEHGDWATNAAMRLARHLRMAPRAIAEDIIQRLRDRPLDADRVAACEIAAPGFINFRVAEGYLHRALGELLAAGSAYGQSSQGAGKRALVEFVSANPTGPLTVGHGRNAVLGDTIANLLGWTGYAVTREYYFNDAGRQMRVLGESVRARYEEVLAESSPPEAGAHEQWEEHAATYRTKVIGDDRIEVPASFPDGGYQGAYIKDIARTLVDTRGAALLAETSVAVFKEAAKEAIFADMAATLARLDIRMDTFFNERSLYENGAIARTLDDLRALGHVFDRDGAVWFKTSQLGKDTDTVLVKSTGEPTYRLPDIAYHRDKYHREYDVLVNIFGADHIATYPDITRALEVLGYDGSKLEVLIYQFVTLMRGGEEVKMSTRKANYVTLDELIDEVGADVTRFFFLMRAAQTHLEFDLDLAKEASDKNPVFYLQYAHARICSILQKAEETGFSFAGKANLQRLTHEAEGALIKELLRFPEVLRQITAAREAHRLGVYLRGVAESFTRFYHWCRIIGEEEELATARIALARAARLVLRNGLAILGISAPERM